MTQTEHKSAVERLEAVIAWLESFYDRNKGDLGNAVEVRILQELNELRAIRAKIDERDRKVLAVAEEMEHGYGVRRDDLVAYARKCVRLAARLREALGDR